MSMVIAVLGAVSQRTNDQLPISHSAATVPWSRSFPGNK
jgi:hypothetical protein